MSEEIELSPEVESIITKLSQRMGVSPGAVVASAVLAFAEDYADLTEASEISRRIRSGEEVALSLADVEARLGLGG